MSKLILEFKNGDVWAIDIEGEMSPSNGKSNEENMLEHIEKVIETDGPLEANDPNTKKPINRTGSEIVKYYIEN